MISGLNAVDNTGDLLLSFITELNRRNVFRVGIAYAVASWVLLRIVRGR